MTKPETIEEITAEIVKLKAEKEEAIKWCMTHYDELASSSAPNIMDFTCEIAKLEHKLRVIEYGNI